MRMRSALAAVAFACSAANALETAQWPPPDSVAARMKALQETLASAGATPARREAAREELAGLLKSPAGQARGRSRDEKPARAAIDQFPSTVGPTPAPVTVAPPAGGVARLEVVEPPRLVVDTRTGSAAPEAGRFAIDPRTGSVLHETPGGFIDPKTGRFVPR
ncbi:MAG: hypothetical protein ABIR98_15960 [Usitatibacter sp.]